ncbi:MAG: hypothetical protein P4N59_06365, partial [Negativicutes bacterium]|nr:hypothetical protein [Negativicutes bacterium]
FFVLCGPANGPNFASPSLWNQATSVIFRNSLATDLTRPQFDLGFESVGGRVSRSWDCECSVIPPDESRNEFGVQGCFVVVAV